MGYGGMLVLDITDSIVSLKFSAINAKDTYASYIHVSKMIFKNEAVLSLLNSLSLRVAVMGMLVLPISMKEAYSPPLRRTAFS